MTPPVAKKKPHKYEIHNRKIVDNYYWLKNRGEDEVIKYLEEENAYTLEKTAQTNEFQEVLFQEMKNRIKETDETVPIKFGEYFYYARNEEGKNYWIHCRKLESLDAREEVLLDENALAEDKKYLSIGSMRISSDHKRLAYTVDFAGDEIYELHILDLSSGNMIDKLTEVAPEIEWGIDGGSLFYTERDDIHRVYAVSHHIVGTNQSEGKRILKEDDKAFMVFLQKSKDQSHLFIHSRNLNGEISEIHFLDLTQEDYKPKLFSDRSMKSELMLEHHDGFFYLLSDHEEKAGFRLYKTNVSEIGVQNWESVSDRIFDARLPYLYAFQRHLVILARKNGYACLSIFDFASRKMVDIEMPEPIYSINLGNYSMSDIFYFNNPDFYTALFRFYFSSLVTPRSVYEYNMKSDSLKLLKVEEIKDHDPAKYVTERRYAVAKDGMQIPISLAYRKDLELNGSTPLLLYGYGSYGLPSDPGFFHRNLSLLERGMILAYAHVRGGGEYGKRWYHAGKLSHKMNTFTDFITCAEYLVDENFTNPENLCAWGGSAGGLLMGAISNLRPDLFKCILARVPFVDVINTMLDDTIPLTTFEYTEWGNPNVREEFEWMIEYSPYDNVEAKNYPDMLITAGYNDPRVQYWEPAKWTAKLRALKTDNNRLLLKTKMETGHFSASGRYDFLRDFSFNWAFILDSVGLAERVS